MSEPTDYNFFPNASLTVLKRRAELLQAVRSFFDNRGFFEVETPVLSHDVVVDEHLDPLSVILPDDVRQPLRGQKLWLQTSPEFGMKRLVAAGATAIYQITRAFRGGEAGPLHNPEFTIVEWYRVGDDYLAGMQLLSDLAAEVLEKPAAERVAYRDAFVRHAGYDPHAAAPPAELLDGLPLPMDRRLAADFVLSKYVQPQLGIERPSILYDYPPDQAALARVRPGPPAVAERFELFVSGIELANGYHELLDAEVLRARNQENNRSRQREGKPVLPEQSRLLAAMEHGLPACSGCALGFDRLVMVAVGAKSLAEVMAFPIDRA